MKHSEHLSVSTPSLEGGSHKPSRREEESERERGTEREEERERKRETAAVTDVESSMLNLDY